MELRRNVMTAYGDDYIEILLRLDRIGITEYANDNIRPAEDPSDALRAFKHLTPAQWRRLTREERAQRAAMLARLFALERQHGLTL
jgi:hypothetical protein